VHRALLVGISSTSYLDGAFPELPGVATDVEAMAALLRARHFDVAVVPCDANADDVASQLANFVDATGGGDVGVIYLAGHGYEIPDTSKDEIDGWDESFVCADRPISDDWFRDQLWPRARPKSRFVVVVDACHSASMVLGLRACTGSSPEPPPTMISSGFYRLTMSACRDKETTLELAKGDEGGGVVTTEMLGILRRDQQVSYRDLWSRVATSVRDRYYVQGLGAPQLSYHGRDTSLLTTRAFAADQASTR
jgi:hypothetical protein